MAFLSYSLILFIEKVAFNSHALIEHHHEDEEEYHRREGGTPFDNKQGIGNRDGHEHGHGHGHGHESKENTLSSDNKDQHGHSHGIGDEHGHSHGEEGHGHSHGKNEDGHVHSHGKNEGHRHDPQHNHDNDHTHDQEHNKHEHNHSHEEQNINVNERDTLKDPLLPRKQFSEDGKNISNKKMKASLSQVIVEEKDENDDYGELRPIKMNPSDNTNENELSLKKNYSASFNYPLVKEFNMQKNQENRRRVKTIDENSDEDEEALKTVVSSKGHFSSFLQFRNISKILFNKFFNKISGFTNNSEKSRPKQSNDEGKLNIGQDNSQRL